MAGIANQIRAHLNDPVDIALNGWPYVAAIRAVVTRHASDGRFCKDDGMVYPCRTVRDIGKQLGVFDVPMELATMHSWVCADPACPNTICWDTAGDCPNCFDPLTEIDENGEVLS
jgi:hypothetical protein